MFLTRAATTRIMRPSNFQQLRNSSMKPRVFQEKGEIHVFESAADVVPFNPFQNKFKLCAKFCVWLGGLFAFPFFYVNHSMRPKN